MLLKSSHFVRMPPGYALFILFMKCGIPVRDVPLPHVIICEIDRSALGGTLLFNNIEN
jgi:hypothetical protein